MLLYDNQTGIWPQFIQEPIGTTPSGSDCSKCWDGSNTSEICETRQSQLNGACVSSKYLLSLSHLDARNHKTKEISWKWKYNNIQKRVEWESEFVVCTWTKIMDRAACDTMITTSQDNTINQIINHQSWHSFKSQVKTYAKPFTAYFYEHQIYGFWYFLSKRNKLEIANSSDTATTHGRCTDDMLKYLQRRQWVDRCTCTDLLRVASVLSADDALERRVARLPSCNTHRTKSPRCSCTASKNHQKLFYE